ncbi:MAG TPA: 3-keto-5-aminohexanoate cleavage protein, partial [Phycisphaerae bacterium]|nr:3-keto-5-aminohexanoate cleavage protein [Phycisphaerae bacterium]
MHDERGEGLSSYPSIQAALNGTRTRAEHPAIPITPAQQATEAHASVAAGAGSIHVHVRDEDGNESLAETDVANTIDAIRRACPGIPIGIGTGAWIIPGLRHRLAVIRSWSTLPDFASVNLHEAGAAEVIELLLERGVGVEAGIWNAPAAASLVRSGLADYCLRILLEP